VEYVLQKNAEALIATRKEIGLEGNSEKTKDFETCLGPACTTKFQHKDRL